MDLKLGRYEMFEVVKVRRFSYFSTNVLRWSSYKYFEMRGKFVV